SDQPIVTGRETREGWIRDLHATAGVGSLVEDVVTDEGAHLIARPTQKTEAGVEGTVRQLAVAFVRQGVGVGDGAADTPILVVLLAVVDSADADIALHEEIPRRIDALEVLARITPQVGIGEPRFHDVRGIDALSIIPLESSRADPDARAGLELP